MSKNAKALSIKTRDRIKGVQNDWIKKLKNAPKIPEDKMYRVKEALEAMAAIYLEQAEKMYESKIKELMGDN